MPPIWGLFNLYTMAINVILGEVETQTEKPFPKLMKEKESGHLFYFHRKCVGLPLQDPARFSDNPDWAYSWIMDCFTDYNEPVTIQNA